MPTREQILAFGKRLALGLICAVLDVGVYTKHVLGHTYNFYSYFFYFVYSTYARICIKRSRSQFVPLIMHPDGLRFRVHMAGYAGGSTPYTPPGSTLVDNLDTITPALETFLLHHDWNAKLLKMYLAKSWCYQQKPLHVYYQMANESGVRVVKWDLDTEKNLLTHQPLCFGDLSFDDESSRQVS